MQKYKKAHPKLKMTEDKSKNKGKDKDKNKGQSQSERGRKPSRDRGGGRSNSNGSRRSAAAQGSRSPGGTRQPCLSNPPSKACRMHVLHKCCGGPPCNRKGKDGGKCDWKHDDPISPEDKEWAKKHKPSKPRRNSPAGGRRSAASKSSPGSRGRGKDKKKKKKRRRRVTF